MATPHSTLSARSQWLMGLFVAFHVAFHGGMFTPAAAAQTKSARLAPMATNAPSAPIGTEVPSSAVVQRQQFVPLKDLQALLEREPRGMLLPRAQFEALRQQAEAQRTLHTAPVAQLVAECQYNITIQGDQLLIEANARLEQLTPDWKLWSFPFDRLAIERATVNGQPAALGRSANGELQVLTRGAGTHEFRLELSTELVTVGSDQVAGCSLLKSAVGRLRFQVPAGKRLVVDGAEQPRPAALDRPATYEVAVGGKTQVQLRLTDREQNRAGDSVLMATSGYGLYAAPGEVTWTALTTFHVFGPAVDRMTVWIPKSVEVTDVESVGLDHWELAERSEHPQQMQLTLSYSQPVEGSRKITLRGVMVVPAQSAWTAPTLTMSGATSHVGQILVQYAPGVRLQVTEMEGARRATVDDHATLSALRKSSATQVLQFNFYREDFNLQLAVQPKERELQAGVAAVLDLAASGVELTTAITVTPRFASLFDLDIDLPAEWTVNSARESDGQELTWQVLTLTPGVNRIRIPLPEALAAGNSRTLELTLRRAVEGWPVEQAPVNFALPALYLPQATVVETAIAIKADADLEVSASSVDGLDVKPLKSSWERLRLQSQLPKYSAELRVVRRRTLTSVESVGVFRLDRQTLNVSQFAILRIEGGGLRELQVSLPDSVPEVVRFQTQGVALVEQQSLGIQAGRRLWTLRFAQRVLGEITVTTQFSVPRTAGIATMSCPQLQVHNVERSFGAVVVEAAADQRITLTAVNAEGTPLADLDPLDLPPLNYDLRERIVATFRTIGEGHAVTLTEQRFDHAAIPTAVCSRLQLLTVLSRTGELQQRAQYQLQLVGVQELQAELSESTELWAATLDNEPVEIRRDGSRLIMSLPPGRQGEISATLQLFYRNSTTELQGSGTLREQPPVLGIMSGAGQLEPMEVLEQTWELVHPAETLIIENATLLEPTRPLDSAGWLVRALEGFHWPHVEDLGWSALWLAIIAGTFALIALMVRSSSVRTGIMVVGCLLFISALLMPCLIPASRMGLVSSHSTSGFSVGSIQSMDSDTDGMLPSSQKSEEVAEEFKHEIDQPPVAAKSAPMAEPVEAFDSSELSRKRMDERKLDQGTAELSSEAGARVYLAFPEDPPADPPAPAKKPAQAVAGQPATPRDENLAGDRGRARQGLLSLALEIQRPERSLSKEFRYVGGGHPGSGVPLQIEYLDRREGLALRGFLWMTGLLMGWWMRGMNCRARILLALTGFLIASGLAPVVPVDWQPTMDGLFLWTLGLVSAWLLAAAFSLCRNCCGFRCPPVARVAALLLVLAGTLPAAEPADKPAEKTASPAVASPQRELQTFIYENEQQPPAADRVFIPAEKFLELYRLAHPELPTGKAAPMKAAVVEADYVARLLPLKPGSDAAVEIRARLTIVNPSDESQSIVLPFHNVVVKVATLDGKPAALLTSSAPWKVIVPPSGTHVLDLELQLSRQGTETSGVFQWNLLPTPAARLSLELPEANTSVRVNGSTTAYRKVQRADKSWIDLPVAAGGDLRLSWQPEQARGGEALVHVDSLTALSFADAGVTASVGLQYRVRQGVLRDVAVRIPPELKLQTVSGPDVGGWELAGEGADRKLRIFLRRNVSDSTQLTIDGFLGKLLTDAPINVPQLVPLEVTTESGMVAVYAAAGYSVRAEDATRVTQVDATAFQPVIPITRIDAPAQLVYRCQPRPWSLSVRGQRVVTRLQASVRQGVHLGLRNLVVTARIQCDLRQLPLSSLQLHVPSDWLILDIKSPGLDDWYRTPPVDATAPAVLHLDFPKPQLNHVEVVLTATQPRPSPTAAVTLQVPMVVDAERQTSQIALWQEVGLVLQATDLGGWETLDPGSVASELQHLQPAAATLAFQKARATTTPVVLQVQQQQPQLTGTSLSMVTVTDVANVYGFVFQWQIDRAATETLSLEMPSWLAGRLQFQSADIREATPTPLGDSATLWTLQLRGPFRGTFRVAATATLPPAPDRISAPAIRFVQSTNGVVQPLDTQQHYLLLINTSLGQLSTEDASLVEPVQLEDVNLVIRKELVDQATEFVRMKTAGVAPTWVLQRYQPAATLPAAVNLADLRTVVARDGTYRTIATYTLKNRRRQFLAIRLPETTRLMSVLVGEQPSRAVRAKINDRDAFLIGLPKGSDVDLSFPVKVVYSGALPAVLPRRSDLQAVDLQIPAAEIISQAESDEFGIPVARTQWAVELPNDLHAVPIRDAQRHNLNQVTEADNLYAESTVSVLLKDAEDLVSAVNGLLSLSSKSRALSNLEQLDKALDLYSAGPHNPERALQAGRVKESLAKLHKSLESGEISENTSLEVIEAQDVDSLRRQLRESPTQGGDAKAQLGRAATNNGLIILDNRNTSDFQSDSLSDRFFLDLSIKSPQSGLKDKDAAAEKTKGNTLEARQRYQALNEQQLQQLQSQRENAKQDSPAETMNLIAGSIPQNRRGAVPSRPDSQGRAANTPTPVQRNYSVVVSPESDTRRSGAIAGTERDGRFGQRFRIEQERVGGGMGGMGGMGGGIGGMGGGENDFEAVAGPAGIQSREWQGAGGLSLPLEIPSAGQRILFSKSGGDPRLELRVRTVNSIQNAIGLVWAILCLGGLASILLLRNSLTARTWLSVWGGPLLSILAALAFVTLVAPWNFAALFVFMLAMGLTVAQQARWSSVAGR